MNINLVEYRDFVESVTSNPSNHNEDFLSRLSELMNNDLNVNIPLLLTAGIGLAAESGEANEIIKKMLFQGKPLNEDNIHHLTLELSDIIWYWVNACRAINVDPYKVLEMNMQKLSSRYPGGKFDAYFSENRREGDL